MTKRPDASIPSEKAKQPGQSNDELTSVWNDTDFSESLSTWSGYFKKTLRERQDQLELVFPHLSTGRLEAGGLENNVADVMVENCIGTLGLPLGVAPTFFVNGKHYVVPMAVEEPSVIAAASGAAKLIAKSGGFMASSTSNIMTGQVQVLDVEGDGLEAAAQRIRDSEAELVSEANQYCASMVRRGGGVLQVFPRIVLPRNKNMSFGGCLVVHVQVDVCEAMGANVVNTIVEGMSDLVARIARGRVGLRILSNLCLERRTKAKFCIPVGLLGWKGFSGADVAARIVEAYEFAESDEFRAVTHNKGIMNGIDAVSVACGQDWRAIEAAAHAYASRKGHYGSLSTYRIENDCLVGELELPISVGVKGGALHTHPVYAFSLDMLGSPSTDTLAQIIVCVGLAQNLAAVRALAVEGIQKGHMTLHARNIAVGAGVPNVLVPEVASYMASRKKISQDAAKEYLQAHSLYQKIFTSQHVIPQIPSTLYVELALKDLSEPLTLNVALPTLSKLPVHISLSSSKHSSHAIANQLLGEGKSIEWLASVYETLDRIKLHSREPPRANMMLQSRLKIVSIMLNVLADRLIHTHPNETSELLQQALNSRDRRELLSKPMEDPILSFGHPLLLTLWQMFDYNVDQWVAASHPSLAAALKAEQRKIVECIVARQSLKMGSGDSDDDIIGSFMSLHAKRWQATCILLCDAVSITPASLTDERLEFLQRLGQFFEVEAMFSHDVARLKRDQTEAKPNVYLQWLAVRNLSHTSESLERFWSAVDRICRTKRRLVLDAEENESFFDAKLFVRTSNYIREYYGVPCEILDDTPHDSDMED